MQLPAPSHYKIKKTVAIAVSAVAIAIAGLSSFKVYEAQAQISDPQPTEHITLDAIPPRVGENGELTAAPGEVLQSTIKVRNSSNKPISIKSMAQDFIIGEDGETPVPIDEEVSQRWSLASWVTVTPEFQDLAPNEVGQVNVIINIPTDALPGGHYAMITHQPANGSSSLESGAIDIPESAAFVNQKVGSLFYLVVEGPINEEAFIRDLTLPKFTEFGPVPLALAVDNQSDIHIKPRISIEITNMFGQLVETIQLDEKNIFPLSSRNYEGAWDRMWGIGLYKATAVMSYGSTGKIIMAHQSFWLFPITLFWVAIIILLVIIVLTISVRRHLHHRNDQSKERVQELEEKLAQLEQKNQNIDS